MSVLEEGQIKIHTENIFPIIKKAVYSDHEIFLRELISNSVDAISKRRMAAMAGDSDDADEYVIQITLNKEENILTISDNGIGMSADEVKKYINQVAFSSAEEFLQKYQKNSDEIIGHFGLGFYSSFMVAKKVELYTLSSIPNSTPVKWTCDGSPNFTLEEVSKDEVGTVIRLHLMEEEIEFVDTARIRNLITKYCDFMPVKIQLEGETINKQSPVWRKNPQDIEDKEYIELYNYLYPFQGDPLFWIHLNTDYPYNLQGILYFPKLTGRADWENGEIKLFCNQVYVSDSIKEIVPRYLLPLRGVIDSPDIPLNVSRSALQTDRRVRSIGNFVAKKIANRLKELKGNKPEFYAEIWDSISPFIKIGLMEDEKFSEQVEDLILFKTTIPESKKYDENSTINFGNSVYTTLSEYKNRINSEQKTILYCTDETSQASALKLWVSQGNEVINADTVIDTQLIPWLESKSEDYKFLRVDSELSEDLNDTKSEIKGPEGETISDDIKSLVVKSIKNEKVTVQVKALKGNESPPAIILLPEQMRRINDMGALMEQRLPGLPENHVLLINLGHPLIKGLQKLISGSVLIEGDVESPSETLAKQIALYVYDMARLGVGGLDPSELTSFQHRTAEVMGKLVDKAL